jgi:DNA-3-methyladenine glycosylase I
VHDDRHLFKRLTQEGAQVGLSWLTILKKRGNYRRAFDNLDRPRTAAYSTSDVERLMGDVEIVRNRLKIEPVIRHARMVLTIQEDGYFAEVEINLLEIPNSPGPVHSVQYDLVDCIPP